MQHCPSCGHEQAPDAPGTPGTPGTRCVACGEWLGEPEVTDTSSGWASDPTPHDPAPPESAEPPAPVATSGFDPPLFDPAASSPPADPFAAEAPDAVPASVDDAPVFDVDAPSVPARAATTTAARPSRGSNATLTLALLGGAFAIALVLVVIIAGRAAPEVAPGDDPEPDQPVADAGPPEFVKLRRAELDTLRDAVADVEKNETTQPIIDSVNALYVQIRKHWSERDWSAVDRDLSELEPKLNELTRIDREQKDTAIARAAAERTRDAVAEARSRAERAGAIELAAKLWASAQADSAKGAELYKAGDYPEAQANWNRALTNYEQANSLASAGVTAKGIRDRVQRRTTSRFTREQLDTSGGAAWQQVIAALEDGDAAYAKAEYADAISRYEHAGDTIEAAEKNVQRALGVKFYAVSAGYLAASILLEHASGQYLDEVGHESLVEAYRNIGLDAATLAKVPEPNGDKLVYRLLGNALAIQLRDAIRTQRGDAVQKAYNVGFQLRLVQKLLGEEGEEKLTEAHRTEVGKSLLLVARETKAAEFADDLSKEIEAVRAALTRRTDTDLEAIRDQWMTIVGRLSRYETAIKIVGPAQP